jgi:hypothetical protein
VATVFVLILTITFPGRAPGLREEGLNWQVVFAGNPLQSNVIVETIGPLALTLKLRLPTAPSCTVKELLERLSAICREFTVSLIPEVLPAKIASPPYFAVTTCVPGAREDVVKLACPFSTTTLASIVAPSKKVTAPVGTPVAGPTARTEAINDTP